MKPGTPFLDLVILNMDIRNKLRLGSNFEVFEHKEGRWFVRSTFTKHPRLWVATLSKHGFNFQEVDIEANIPAKGT